VSGKGATVGPQLGSTPTVSRFPLLAAPMALVVAARLRSWTLVCFKKIWKNLLWFHSARRVETCKLRGVRNLCLRTLPMFSLAKITNRPTGRRQPTLPVRAISYATCAIPAAVIFTVLTGPSALAIGCRYPAQNQAVIFQDANRGGKCRTLAPGLYPTPSYFAPVPNDQLSSLDVGANSRVVLSEDANFLGHQMYFDGGSFYNLGGNENDITSAVEVFPAAGGPMAAYYMGDYPANVTPWWAEEVQGIAHDDSNWFITQTQTLLKKSLGEPLENGTFSSKVQIPSTLFQAGYNHFGDLDQAYGYLFVPMQGNNITPALAVFRGDDLSLVGWQPLPQLPLSGGAWVAYRPNTDTFFLSAGDISNTQPLYEYRVRFETHSANPVHVTLVRTVYLYDRRNAPVTINTTQGGVFNPSGTLLYIVNGCASDDGAINIFNLDVGTTTGNGTLQGRSENGFGPFNFEHHGGIGQYFPDPKCTGEEPEGIDFFDTTGLDIPRIPDSQLHVLLLRNALGSDGVYVKHYSY
jgi:hypothetical protein